MLQTTELLCIYFIHRQYCCLNKGFIQSTIVSVISFYKITKRFADHILFHFITFEISDSVSQMLHKACLFHLLDYIFRRTLILGKSK